MRDFRKDGGSRVGKNAKPVVVTVKRRRKVCVRGIQLERGEGVGNETIIGDI